MTRRTHWNLEPLEERSLLSGLGVGPTSSSALAYSLTTNQSTYQPGQPVEMTFQETNDSHQTIMVQEGPSLDGFIVTQGGKSVWRSNAGLNPLYIIEKTLKPGQSMTLSATWNGIPTGGTSPVSGQFVITNELTPNAKATITIAGPASTSPPSTGQTPPTSSPAPGAPSGTDPAPVPSPTPSTPAPSPIAVTVGMDHPTYRKGHPVRMTATLHNVSDSAVALAPNSNGDGFTVLEGSTVVWHSARTSSRTLEPGHSVKLTAVWNGKAHLPGATLAPGTYTIEAVEGSDSGSSTIRITA
jgi:hypothetical protein